MPPAELKIDAFHQALVDRFVNLYLWPEFGPDYARHAVAEYLKSSNCQYPKIGHAVKAALDLKEKNGSHTA